MKITPVITPTPIQKISCAEASGNRIYIKRDDLLPYSFGGNKVRISRAFMEDARRKGADGIIIYGDRRSNLCRVMAGMCYEAGLPCVMVETSEHGEDAEEPFNSRLIRSLNVKVLPCRKDEIASAVDEAFEWLRSRGRIPYYIYGSRLGTGNEAVAASAYADAYEEILAQEAQAGLHFDEIFLPCGTGSTQGGLICGKLKSKDEKTQITGISISSRSGERALSVLEKTVVSYFDTFPDSMHRPDIEKIRGAIHLETGYNQGGYGLYNERTLQVIRSMLTDTSIPLDPVYSGKAFCGMLDYIREHNIHGERILFLHTGGLPLFIDAYPQLF